MPETRAQDIQQGDYIPHFGTVLEVEELDPWAGERPIGLVCRFLIKATNGRHIVMHENQTISVI